MKTLFKILGVVVVLLVVAFFAASFFIGSIVKNAVNTAGPKMTGTKVEVQSVGLSIFTGSCTIKGLVVGNPEGFQKENAFYLGKIDAKVSIPSLFGDHIIVEKMVIESPEVYFEGGIGSNNFQTLLANVEKNTSGGTKTPSAKPDAPEEQGEAKEMKIEIRHFSLSGVKLTAAVTGLKEGSITVPTIELNDVGTKEGGVTPAQAAVSVLKDFSGKVAAAAVEGAKQNLLENPQDVKQTVKDAAKGVKDLFKK